VLRTIKARHFSQLTSPVPLLFEARQIRNLNIIPHPSRVNHPEKNSVRDREREGGGFVGGVRE